MHFIYIRTDVHRLFTTLRLLGYDNLLLRKERIQSGTPVSSRLFSLTELYRIIRCCHKRHGRAGLAILYLTGRTYGNTIHHNCVQTVFNLFGWNGFSKFHIKVLTKTGCTNTKWCCKGHNHVRAVSTGESNRKPGTADCLLEVTHRIQMSHKFHMTGFGKFNSYFHSTHLLCI